MSGVPGGEIISTVEDFAGDVLWVGGGVCTVGVCTVGVCTVGVCTAGVCTVGVCAAGGLGGGGVFAGLGWRGHSAEGKVPPSSCLVSSSVTYVVVELAVAQ